MRNFILIVAMSFFWGGCEKYEIIDTGVARQYHDCSMWDYFHTDPYDWDSVIVAIEHAGVQDIFDGTNPDYPQITFFGMTNWSVKHFIMHTYGDDGERMYGGIRDIPKELCRKMILSHVVAGKIMKDEFDYEVKNTLKGGTIVKTLTGIDLRVFRTTSDYRGVPDIGPEGLGIEAVVSKQLSMVASANIVTTNGVVHSLVYEYEWNEL